jgi:predicted GIY-YIG superfamily endonuclease
MERFGRRSVKDTQTQLHPANRVERCIKKLPKGKKEAIVSRKLKSKALLKFLSD